MSYSDIYWESTSEVIPTEIRSVLNEYLLCLKLENKAVATITKYKWILERFLRECTIPLEDLHSDDVRKWLNEFSVEKKPKTIDLVIATLSSFFNFCLDEEYMDKAVMKKRWKPKIPKSLPKYLDEYEYTLVKRLAEEFPIRDRAIILFLFSSGCRVSELCFLNIKDINFKQREAKIKGKGGKLRQIHFQMSALLFCKSI